MHELTAARLDAVVVGAGPNGLAAAIVIAQTGRRVMVFEAAPTVGGGCRSEELTLPGVVHDVCSAVHPFAVASPCFRTFPLNAHGLAWVTPPVMVAHPLEGGTAACVYGSVEKTATHLQDDTAAYRRVIGALVESWPEIEDEVLGPLRWPRHPLALSRFGWRALRGAEAVGRGLFRGDAARALFAGMAAHSMLPLDRAPTAGVALSLTVLAHREGWSFPRGGAQRLADALASYLRTLGGEIVTGTPITSLDDLPPAPAILFDLSPRPLLRIIGDRFPPAYRRALERYQYGLGVYKVDWVLDGPVPWRNAECAQAGTVHVGGSLEEIAASERAAWQGRHAEAPFVLVAQPTAFDPTRAPDGRHVLWTYCHTPNGSTFDMLPRIEQQIERFAPGFRDRVLARHIMRPVDLEQRNPNFVGGDIGSGAVTLTQLFTRPTWRTYATPLRGMYLCSASTPPGVGVHGMCGYHAAQLALREVLRD
jgi:phytoene dehydrogenase-like protein